MGKPHVHSALIKQWADGAKIQYLSDKGWWLDADGAPSWRETTAYRVKPEPKPDTVKIRKLTYNADLSCIFMESPGKDQMNGNIMFIFDGETGALKDVQLLTKG